MNPVARTFWSGTGGLEWHASKGPVKYGTVDVFRTHERFMNLRELFLVEVGKFLATAPRFTTLCEIGTGHGFLLKVCQERFSPPLNQWMGMDLNAEQTALNRERFPELTFETASINDWIAEQPSIAHILFMAVGTLQYLTREELVHLFAAIAKGRSSLALLEPTNGCDATPRGDYGAINYDYGRLANEAELNAMYSDLIQTNRAMVLR